MFKYLFAIALMLLPLPLAAADPMNAAEFEAYVEGKTLQFQSLGRAYGAEQYLTGRRVLWTFLDGDCHEGHWYEDAAGLICFVYEGRPEDPQCWSFWEQGGGLAALFENDPAATQIFEARQSDEPLACRGPKVGV